MECSRLIYDKLKVHLVFNLLKNFKTFYFISNSTSNIDIVFIAIK